MTGPLAGGLDVGGTKMLAQLFDGRMQVIAERREPTPTGDYDSFINTLVEMLARMGPDMPVGVSLAGFVDPQTGIGVASNLPITGRPVARDLTQRLGWSPAMINDCDAFALSEAVDGAGAGASVMVGLILGTGMAAGLCVDGRLAERGRAQAVEIGHVGLPLRVAERYGLGLWPCGCGLEGCYERYVCGAGLTRLSEHLIGRALTGEQLGDALRDGDLDAARLFRDWCDIVAEALSVIHMMNDPQVIVLGGGLSALPGLVPGLTRAFQDHGLPGTPRPDIRLAAHGGVSGARGAALLAVQERM